MDRFSSNLYHRCIYVTPFIDQKATLLHHFLLLYRMFSFWHKKRSGAQMGDPIGPKLGTVHFLIWGNILKHHRSNFGRQFSPSYPAIAFSLWENYSNLITQLTCSYCRGIFEIFAQNGAPDGAPFMNNKKINHFFTKFWFWQITVLISEILILAN